VWNIYRKRGKEVDWKCEISVGKEGKKWTGSVGYMREKGKRSGQEVWDICKKRGKWSGQEVRDVCRKRWKEVVRKQGISAGKRRAVERKRGISVGK
jgi:hypothetical protein